MTLALGTVKPGSTITIPFNTFDSNDPSASVAIAAFVLADIGIYSGTNMTERGSTTGVVLLDTDGIDIDAAVGIGGFTIDLSSNATDDFYVAGTRYYVTVGPVTVDAAVVNFLAATFDIGYPGAILDAQIATLASQTSFTITNAPTDDSSLVGCSVIVHDQASATQFAVGYVSAYTTAANTITLKADPGIFTIAAGDNVSFFMPANVQAVAGTTQTALDINDILTDTNEIQGKLPSNKFMGSSDGADDDGNINAILVDTGTTIPDILRGLVPVNGTIGATGNTTTKLHLVGLTYGNDEINGWTLIVFDNSNSEYHQCLVTDWVLSTALATVEVSDGQVLPFTPEASTDKYWLVTPSTTNNVMDRVITGATHNKQNSLARRIRGIQEFQGYEGGAVWIDTQDGTSGTTNFENGTVELPVDSIADALTIAASLNLKRFVVLPGSTIALGATFTNKEMEGHEWILDLDGRNIGGSEFVGATVSGTGTGSGTTEFLNCFMNATTIPAGTHLIACDLEGTITFGAAGTFYFENVQHASAAPAIIDFGGALNASTLHMHPYHGAIEIQNMGAGTGSYVAHMNGDGPLTINANCSATSTINISGNGTITNNASGITINDDGRYDVAQVAVAVYDEAMTESSGPPSVTASFRDAWRWIFALSRNKVTQTSTTMLLRNDADDGTIGTSTVSDDSTTAIRGEFS